MSAQLVPGEILLYANKAAQTIASGGEDLTWNVPIEQNGISQVTPVQINLLANHTYELKAYFTVNNPAVTYFAFWSTLANAPVGAVNAPAIGSDQLTHSYAIAIFRPTVDTIVKVRVLSGVGTTFEAESIISIVALN